MRKLQLNEEVYFIPGTWNELTTVQLLYLIKLVNKKASAEEIKLKMLLFCMGARVHTYRKTDREIRFVVKCKKRKYDLSAEDLYVIADIFSFLFFVEENNISIDPLLTKNPLPEIRIKRKTFIGPDEGLSNISYGQFIMLLTYYQQIQNAPEAINDFISVIYKTEADQNAPVNLISKLSSEEKTLILWFYLGSTQFLAEKFPITFSGGGSGSGGTVFENQMRVVDALASNDVTKKEIVKNALLYDALYSLEIAAENAEKQK